VAVAAAKGLRGMPAVERFVVRYPGTVTPGAGAVTGTPLWVGVQHFLNLFLLMFIMRSGLQILSDHPRLYWTRHSTPGRDWFRIQKPVPTDPLWTAKQDSISLPGQVGLPGIRHSIGLARWWHLGVNTLWLANGLLFYVLLFATGQWRRLVPTSWDAFPHALSVMVQYASLDWPTENGWVAYNSLQQIAYFLTVFIAAPLAVLTGLGMSPALSTRFKRISTVLSIQTARSLHFLVLIWFLVFITTHIALVATTGVLRNLNHIYTGRDGADWVGFAVFAASMVIVTVGWVAATPLTLRHPRLVQRVGYALIGPVQRLFEHVDATPGQYTEKTSPPTCGTTANTPTRLSTRRCSRVTSPTTGYGSTAWLSILSSWTWRSCGGWRTPSRSPSTSASRGGPASRSGAACRCRPSWTWFSPTPRPSGSSSTPSLTARTAASTTTPTPLSR